MPHHDPIPAPPPPSPVAAPPPEVTIGPADRSRRRRRLGFLGAVLAVAAGVGLLGNAIRLPYYAIAPGDAIDVNDKVSVDGAERYEPEGDVLLLFVRQRARVTVWRWLQAVVDQDIDLFREEDFVGDRTPDEVRDESRADMAGSQYNAKVVALQRLGYELAVEREGARVLYAFETMPAGEELREGDVITAIDGSPVSTVDEIGDLIGRHEAGDRVEVEVVRGNEELKVAVGTEAADGDGHPVIGVLLAPAYEFPFEVEIDTSDIGGPSAGLAMTLAIIDELTPGELTGGGKVAVTGTIDQEGKVGEVGGVGQKAVAARHRGATLLLVPACQGEGEARAVCERDVERARDRAGDVPVEEVASLDQALAALERAGGAPIEDAAPSAA